MAKKTENENKKNTKRLFWGSFFPMVILIIGACTCLYLISMFIIKQAVRLQISLLQEQVTSKVVSMVYPDVLSVENLVNVAPSVSEPEMMKSVLDVVAKSGKGNDVYFASVTPLSKGGLFVDRLNWVPPKDWEPSGRVWFQAAMNEPNHNGVYTDPYIDQITGNLCVTYSKAALNSKGEVIGVAGVDIILSSLDDIIESISSDTDTIKGERYILDSRGNYMTNPDASKISTVNYFKEKMGNDTDVAATLGSVPIFTVTDTIYYGVSKIGDTPWYVVMSGSMTELTSDFKRTVFIIEIIMFAFGFIFSVLNLLSIRKMRESEKQLGIKLYEETQNLVVSTKETAATSQDQSAAVKEIVATMEDSNALSENISTKIKDVSKIAQKTSNDVIEGVASIAKNVEQLHAIYEANQNTINGMKDLNDKIESIWDIVTLINSVADQTKIIAFNAELEATSAGEAGKKFRIVANEIRRLSDGIIDSIHEIKEKITEIQHSSDSLILASESGTEKITSGYETAKELGTKFDSIKSSSEITASSAEDITGIIQQQTIASEQILIALKQISAGIENFTVATDNISSSAENLRIMSETLNKKNQSDEKNTDKKSKDRS